MNEVRFSSYNHSKNPLFSSDEANYWDTLKFPNDIEYNRILNMLSQTDKYALYNKLGHDKYNAFIMRLEEENPELYNKFINTSDGLNW